MKLGGRDAARFIARPDAGVAGILLYGADAMRVALRRQALVAALIGPDGPEEMRLTRIEGAALRRDPAAVQDALRAVGFFPGPRAVLVEDAGDAAGPVLAEALADWRAGDATLVVTGGELKPTNGLRKVFEAAKIAVAIAIYNDPPGREEIATALSKAGLGSPSGDAMADVESLARSLDPGDFAQFIEKLALYKHSDPAPLSSGDIAAVAPPAPGAETDVLLDLAADGSANILAVEMRRFSGGASAATGLVIAAGRHFRALHAAACAPDGPDAALARARPPVFGPRRSRMAGQARSLGRANLEKCLGWIIESDLALRSSHPPPGLAHIERLLVRIAMLKRN